eukprot:SAG11_NODE_35652_length_265_cov_1.500000_2_plen_36_part_01
MSNPAATVTALKSCVPRNGDHVCWIPLQINYIVHII